MRTYKKRIEDGQTRAGMTPEQISQAKNQRTKTRNEERKKQNIERMKKLTKNGHPFGLKQRIKLAKPEERGEIFAGQVGKLLFASNKTKRQIKKLLANNT